MVLAERQPLIVELLRDAQRRARLSEDHAIVEAADRMRIVGSDALDVNAEQGPFDSAYLDPMYPSRDKTALAKKEMRVLRELAGDDADADQLLQTALGYAGRRVVVKRPPRAECLAGRVPDHQWTGNRARYDVYFTRSDAIKPA